MFTSWGMLIVVCITKANPDRFVSLIDVWETLSKKELEDLSVHGSGIHSKRAKTTNSARPLAAERRY